MLLARGVCLPLDLAGYRVFIASPGGLEEERRAFRRVLTEFNEREAIQRGVVFIPVGWEDTLPGMGRPQSLINDEIATCDYVVLLLWDRWGTAPGSEEGFSSGTEEEYHLALRCHADPQKPMADLVVCFKGLDEKRLSDPGPQLQKVLAFRKELEAAKTLLYGTFGTPSELERVLERQLSRWLRNHEQAPEARAAPAPGAARASLVDERMAPDRAPLPEPVEALLREGRWTEAETLLARAAVRGSPEGLREYGSLLMRQGRVEQARGVLERARDAARASGDPRLECQAYAALADLHDVQADYPAAEAAVRHALDLAQTHGWADLLLVSQRRLGVLQWARGDLTAALDSLEAALADATDSLEAAQARLWRGRIRAYRGDVASGRKDVEAALEAIRSSGDKDLLPRALYALAEIQMRSGDLEAAEKTARSSVVLVERGDSPLSETAAYGTLGMVLFHLGKLEEARQMFEKGLAATERAGFRLNLIPSYGNLARVAMEQGDLDRAEADLKKGMRIVQELGVRGQHQAVLFSQYARLYRERGQTEEAVQMQAAAEAALKGA